MSATLKSIQMATVVPGTETPTADGITGAMRCIIKSGQEQYSAILKRGSIEEVTAELLACILLSGWGLPVADPFIIDENGTLAFASGDVSYPNLKHALAGNTFQNPDIQEAATLAAAQIACNLATFPLAVVCDEAIINRDRNLGNILWDGENDIWIDHAYSFGIGSHLPDTNKLCDMAAFIKRAEEMKTKAVGQSYLLDKSIANNIEETFKDVSVNVTQKLNLVTNKLNNITEAVLARFPKPDDLLSGL